MSSVAINIHDDDALAHEMTITPNTPSPTSPHNGAATTANNHLRTAAVGPADHPLAGTSSVGSDASSALCSVESGAPNPYPSSTASTLPMNQQQQQQLQMQRQSSSAASSQQQLHQPNPDGYYERRPHQCATLVRVFKWLPVVFIVAVIGWSWYAYVVQLCFNHVSSVVEQVLYLFFYHIIFAMFVWSYAQTVLTDVAVVPVQFRLGKPDVQRLLRSENGEQYRRILEQVAKDLPVTNRTYNGGVRFCDRCLLIKPDRAHHCSVCNQCVLKMDHHCPWVNNCVSFSNYKYFILFLGYALLYCLFVSLTSLPAFVLFWQGTLDGGIGRFHILFLFFVSVMFALSLCSLFGYHVYLVLKNRTTLEAFRAPIFRVGGPDKNGFHLGCLNNLQEVFGDDRWRWFIPVFSSIGDGVSYPILHMYEDVESLLGPSAAAGHGETRGLLDTRSETEDDDETGGDTTDYH